MIVLYTMERQYDYGCLRSTNASKTKVVLEEKALEYRVERVRPGDVWKKISKVTDKHPLGKVPYIDDGELTVYDSTVIDEYLEDAYPSPALMPSSAAGRARVRALENFADEGVLSVHLPLLWMPWWSPEDKRDKEAMARGRQGLLDKAFPVLERELTGRSYLCDQFSLADVPFMAIAMVLQVDQAHEDGIDLRALPRAAAYFERLRERPSYAAISPQTSLADSAGRSAG
jgi:glutathione S-transferase